MKKKKKPGRKTISRGGLELKQQEIVNAANSLFIERGYEAVSMRKLAQALQVSTMSLYRYFPSKRAILVHIWANIFETVFKNCRRASLGAVGENHKLIAYAVEFVQYWQKHPEHYQMIYGEIDKPNAEERFFIDEDLVLQEVSFVEELLLRAGVSTARVKLSGQQFLCIIHGVSHSLVTIPELHWSPPQQLITGLINGLIQQQKK